LDFHCIHGRRRQPQEAKHTPINPHVPTLSIEFSVWGCWSPRVEKQALQARQLAPRVGIHACVAQLADEPHRIQVAAPGLLAAQVQFSVDFDEHFVYEVSHILSE